MRAIGTGDVHRSGAHLDGSTTGPPTLSLAYLSTGVIAKDLAAAANLGGSVKQQIADTLVAGVGNGAA